MVPIVDDEAFNTLAFTTCDDVDSAPGGVLDLDGSSDHHLFSSVNFAVVLRTKVLLDIT